MLSVLRGIPASPGIVVGPVHLLRWEVPEVRHRVIEDGDIDQEIARFHAAVERARERLRHLRARTEAQAGPEEAAIFDVQLSILDDGELIRSTIALIRQNLGAEKAFDIVLLEWRQHFARSSAPMLREKVGDLTDVHIRVLSLLLDLPDHDPVDVPRGSNTILVTHDLTPSLTMQLDRECIVAIATEAGTATAHVAILARSLGLPAVVGLRQALSVLQGGEVAILDGTEGTLVIAPTDHEVEEARQRVAEEEGRADVLRELAMSEPVTRDGVRLVVRANVDIPEEAEAGADSGAEGVGLMRTEFLVVGRASMPDEEEQYRAYRKVVLAFGGGTTVIRTYDVGGDKLPVGGFPHEANPFLGWRAIRMCLDESELFKVQLRALLRAAVHGDLRIMLPLVVTVDEVRETRQLISECVEELAARRVPFRDDVPLGVMIETPAAAVACDTLVRDVDFFSIGSNDLVQYMLAVDRGNANLAPRYTPFHPAVLRLMAQVQATGAAHGIDVCVCGEMASQPLAVFALLGLGLRQLSVAPRAVADVKRIIRGVRADVAADAAMAAMACSTAREAEVLLRRRLRAELG
ncbi:phosphoenolpyruvate--protein phosphotransferase [Gemmatimonas sp.]|jgi:phosphotransferase system enzyme I (PtsI)|uniref:phosphoenolpyruvate--protein phosphotransferase n=2 Tax=Gemmatimonas sp. TaxID=1962908 RepID=UPI0022BD1A33|nr:phosphoenolpyruvate--protein phosphotransferase [Gemmatimonas sp.]MCA2983909.1 phosphoenolpyruvate--protein phosphotransferase [Gemmatimonas sp.]MCA2988845.1 phosphoenolpyruvate--protein phosphotransferase [Gemmatimonas sp.]MCA2991032.1 phosphoenolpyruvate--protein phosphotransferase [Gemmatimonas sp.]MCA2996187.1 phosphoenolpyruvate--protein phosphotransferase [Gemmatimonas sp.]MCE2953541.1 phosphoenolpyruvate--protein phosphotransferase [Gemmatimonas sp.]